LQHAAADEVCSVSDQNKIIGYIAIYTVPVNQSISCAFKFHIVPKTATAIARPLSLSLFLAIKNKNTQNGNGSASDVILPKKTQENPSHNLPLKIVQQKQSQFPCMCTFHKPKCVCVCGTRITQNIINKNKNLSRKSLIATRRPRKLDNLLE